jgi:hypothetical protein
MYGKFRACVQNYLCLCPLIYAPNTSQRWEKYRPFRVFRALLKTMQGRVNISGLNFELRTILTLLPKGKAGNFMKVEQLFLIHIIIVRRDFSHEDVRSSVSTDPHLSQTP